MSKSSKEQQLHIISFDVPYPANYGGVIDVFHKLKALSESGIKIHLHCFEYGRGEAKELEQYCETVHYYKRKMSKHQLLSSKPFIVISRNSNELLENLLKDDYPIVFEGLHTCAILDDERIKDRYKIVRTHNVEHDYYRGLAASETNLFRKNYFKLEAGKLKEFESVLAHANAIAAISDKDYKYYAKQFDNVKLVSAFHPYTIAENDARVGDYALYHGNLDVEENNRAALFLIDVFKQLDRKLVIAGNNPRKELVQAVDEHLNVQLRINPTEKEMDTLVSEANINVLPTFQATGIKLKLLAALYTGKHCLVTPKMVEGTGLGRLCHIAKTASDFKIEIEKLFDTPFAQEEIDKRNKLLSKKFSTQHSLVQLRELL